MEKITKTQESNVIAYATHDIMYMNDMLCNITKSLRDDVKKRDKEANKIYGAIHKRVKKHLDCFMSEEAKNCWSLKNKHICHARKQWLNRLKRFGYQPKRSLSISV